MRANLVTFRSPNIRKSSFAHQSPFDDVEGIWELETPAVMTGGLTGGNSRVAHCYIFLRYPPKLIAYVLLLHYNSCVTHEPKNKCVAFCSVCAYVVRSMYTALPPHSHCNT